MRARAPMLPLSICASMTTLETCRIVEAEGRKAIAIAGDVGEAAFCKAAVEQTVRELGGLDILVNNAGEQHPDKDIQEITEKQLRRTFQTNIFGMFFMVQAAMDKVRSEEHTSELKSLMRIAYAVFFLYTT